MTATQTPSGLSDAQYHEAVQSVLARIESVVDGWLEDDVVDIDSARTGGMLTLSLPNRTQLIINAQPPLQEIWLAAKRGGFHFRSTDGLRWLDTRSGEDFYSVLSACASEQTGKELKF